jgi:hypothetical protein
MIWETLIKHSETLIRKFNFHLNEYYEDGMARFNNPNWVNRTWKNDFIRRAHIDIVDARETKKLWMMHVCIFPELNNAGPIFGWDIIAGEKKVTGAFHDFSPLFKKDHPMIDMFGDLVENYIPSKKRELPDWALKIFSPHMIAAGNIQEEKELKELCFLVEENLAYYLDKIIDYKDSGNKKGVIESQNYYCKHQQQNPHTPRVMQSLGLPEEDIKLFCSDNLFPIIKE